MPWKRDWTGAPRLYGFELDVLEALIRLGRDKRNRYTITDIAGCPLGSTGPSLCALRRYGLVDSGSRDSWFATERGKIYLAIVKGRRHRAVFIRTQAMRLAA